MIGAEPKVGWVLRYRYLWTDQGDANLNVLGARSATRDLFEAVATLLAARV